MLSARKAAFVSMRSLIAVMIAALAAPALGGTYRDDVDDSVFRQIGDGVVARPVGFLEGASPSFDFTGSAVLIRPDVMLTAAHITSIMTGADITLEGNTYAATSWVTHPQYNGNLLSGNDLGLVWLDQPVTNVTPAQLYTGGNEQGKIALPAGYGRYGDGLTGAIGFDGEKRAGTNQIDLILFQNILITDLDRPNDPLGFFFPSYRATPLELLINQGDSGGATFIGEGGQVFVAGIHSFIGSLDQTLGNYGDIAGSVRVSSYVDWINATIENPAGAPTLTFAGEGPLTPVGVTRNVLPVYNQPLPVPEPATALLLGATGLLLMRRRAG